ncbi:MAG: PDZ domain-containing protein [Deltaproteobacteria bacterium]|nr:PDZ domain-containing protein [Deltaproteobacteria bacterium]
MRLPVVSLALSLLLLSARAQADAALWTERPSTPAKVALPSLAPLVRDAGAAVLTIEVESQTAAAMDPRAFRFFGMEVPDQRQRGQGTGFLIHPDGYALTNHHVVENATKIRVRIGGRTEVIPATVVGDDPRTDVALIKLEGRNPAGGPWPSLPLGDSDVLAVGDFVVAIGNPFGLSQSVSMGILSAKGRRDIAPSGRQGLYDFLQTDASINPGNSGGPLLNLAGEVIGINSAVNAAGQGIGFAIPVNLVKKLLPDLKARGHVQRSWIGVAIGRVDPSLAPELGLDRPRGALVTQVVPQGPAYKAGLKPGDLITKFDGKVVEDSSDLPLLAATAGVGRTVQIELLRERELRSARLTLAAVPDAGEGSGGGRLERGRANVERSTRIGVRIDTLDDELRARLGLSGRQHGAVVVGVEPSSVAAEAGLVPGDVVIEANGVAVADRDDFVRALDKVAPGKIVKLLVLREGATTFVALVKP